MKENKYNNLTKEQLEEAIKEIFSKRESSSPKFNFYWGKLGFEYFTKVVKEQLNKEK